MKELFQIGAPKVGTVGNCEGLEPIVKLIKKGVFPIVQIFIPIALIALGTFDLGKAVLASKEDDIKKAQSLLIKRAIYAVAIFFVATIVTIVMGLVAKGYEGPNGDTENWAACWNNVK